MRSGWETMGLILTAMASGKEPLSLDLAEVERVHEDIGTINRGTGLGGAIDLGAFEFQGISCHGGLGRIRNDRDR